MPRLSKAEKERCHKEILEMEQAKIKPYLDRIADLEKENAELKEELTKAKELLKRYVPYRQITNSIAYKDLAEETEQFLNSEVEKC